MTTASIKDILYPDSIATVGASRDRARRAYRSIEKLREDGYAGAPYPVNPKESGLPGLRCAPRPDAVPGPVGLVPVCTGFVRGLNRGNTAIDEKFMSSDKATLA
jgi:acetyltransferase